MEGVTADRARWPELGHRLGCTQVPVKYPEWQDWGEVGAERQEQSETATSVSIAVWGRGFLFWKSWGQTGS